MLLGCSPYSSAPAQQSESLCFIAALLERRLTIPQSALIQVTATFTRPLGERMENEPQKWLQSSQGPSWHPEDYSFVWTSSMASGLQEWLLTVILACVFILIWKNLPFPWPWWGSQQNNIHCCLLQQCHCQGLPLWGLSLCKSMVRSLSSAADDRKAEGSLITSFHEFCKSSQILQ